MGAQPELTVAPVADWRDAAERAADLALDVGRPVVLVGERIVAIPDVALPDLVARGATFRDTTTLRDPDTGARVHIFQASAAVIDLLIVRHAALQLVLLPA